MPLLFFEFPVPRLIHKVVRISSGKTLTKTEAASVSPQPSIGGCVFKNFLRGWTTGSGDIHGLAGMMLREPRGSQDLQDIVQGDSLREFREKESLLVEVGTKTGEGK
jgi:hypothetical protein